MQHAAAEPIRVLHIITRMVRGGAQMNTLANVVGLNAGPWRSTLVTGPPLGTEGSMEPAALAEGVRLIHAPDLVRPIDAARDWRALRQLEQIIRDERPHLVHTHTSKAGALGRLAARRCRVPAVVHTPHGHVFHSYSGRFISGIYVQVERYCARLADRLIVLTEKSLEEHLAYGIAPRERFTVIHSGIDFGPFLAARGERAAVRAELGVAADVTLIGTVGRLAPIKNQQLLLEAFSRLRREAAQPLMLAIVGDGELAGELRRQAEDLGIAEQTRFTGFRADVPRLLAAMDVFALPSLNEGMGRVLLEAMALELPIVASRVGGIPDVVRDGDTGILVPPGDAEALCDALRRLVDDRQAARALAVRGYQHAVPGYSVECMVDRIEAVYREVLAAKGILVPPALAEPAPVAAGVRGG